MEKVKAAFWNAFQKLNLDPTPETSKLLFAEARKPEHINILAQVHWEAREIHGLKSAWSKKMVNDMWFNNFAAIPAQFTHHVH